MVVFQVLIHPSFHISCQRNSHVVFCHSLLPGFYHKSCKLFRKMLMLAVLPGNQVAIGISVACTVRDDAFRDVASQLYINQISPFLRGEWVDVDSVNLNPSLMFECWLQRRIYPRSGQQHYQVLLYPFPILHDPCKSCFLFRLWKGSPTLVWRERDQDIVKFVELMQILKRVARFRLNGYWNGKGWSSGTSEMFRQLLFYQGQNTNPRPF